MKWICTCLVMMISAISFSYAQSTTLKSDTARFSVSFSPDMSEYYGRYVLYILKSDTQTEEILISPADKIVDLVDQNTIASIEVFKGQPAVEKYGEQARNGAVVVHFTKDFKKLPKDLNGRFVRSDIR